MKTYYRILSYVKPYWKHLALSMVCTILYALLNGASVYLTIPLLDTLFQESANKNQQESVESTETSQNIIPDFIREPAQNVVDSFKDYIFEGDISDVLIKICHADFSCFPRQKYFCLPAGVFSSLRGTGRDKRFTQCGLQSLA